jgi:CHAD domain-containing protein
MKAALRLLDDLAEEMKRTADKPTIDAVHDLRVAVRRATEAIRILAPDAGRLRKEIKCIREHAAAVRDRDVTRQLLRRHRLPPGDPACVYLQGQRDLAAKQLQSFLKKQLKKDRPARWQRWLEETE